MGSYYFFNADGTFRSLHTEGTLEEYVEGKWSFNEPDSTLHFKSKSRTQQKVFKVNSVGNGTLVLTDLPQKKATLNKSYLDKWYQDISHHYKFKKDEETVGSDYDFTVKEMNLWRVKPIKPETTGELKKRITANMDYALMFLDAHLESDKKTIEYSGLSSPFVFASNGLALKRINEINQWENIFYDYSQAQEAYNILQTAFNSRITVPENLSYVALQKYLLEELKKQLK